MKELYEKMEKELSLKSRSCRFCVECCLDISDLKVTPIEIDYINYSLSGIFPDFQPLSWQEYNKKSICPYCDIKKGCTIYPVRHRFCRIFGPFMESVDNLYSACVFRENHIIYDENSTDKIPYHKEFCELSREYLETLPEVEQKEYLSYLKEDYSRMEKMKNSIPEYLEFIKKEPSYGPLYYHLGKRYSCLGMKQEAINYLVKSLVIDPTQFQSYYLLAFRLNELRFLEDAIICMKRAVRGAPWHGKARFTLGIFCLEAGKFQEALNHFYKLIEMEPHAIKKYEGLERYINLAEELK